jgi:Ca2+-binding RTX toxin-like protein
VVINTLLISGPNVPDGAGDDVLVGGDGPDSLEGFGGADTLSGGAGDDVLSGGSGADLLEGNSGTDTLDGGSGVDTLRGGAGDDTYVVDGAGDVLTELVGGGTDEVISAVSYTLGSTLESLSLAGTGNLNGTGNSGNNLIRGNAGDNVLNGGSGTDTLMGRDGSDSLAGGSGMDRLEGGLGADTLNGGPGLDAMAGGAGDDVYFVDARGDLITELAGEGTDVVRSAVSRGLPVNVEQLVLTGSADLNGAGNGLANVLSGNSGNNSLSGGEGNDTMRGGFGNDTLLGGLGMDSMIGGAGDDSYSVSRGDKTIESVDGGTDTVKSGIDWTLAAQVEHLLLIGTGSVKGTGNAQGNAITGNQGNNTLDGRAGSDTLDGGIGADVLRGSSSSDTLTGGDGADVFLFDTALSAAGIDLISDFAVGIDKIRLDDDVFAAFTGTVTTLVGADQFVSGAGITAAQDATDRLIYDTDTGALYYDADGVGGVSAVQIAMLGTTTHPGITAGDFVIVS